MGTQRTKRFRNGLDVALAIIAVALIAAGIDVLSSTPPAPIPLLDRRIPMIDFHHERFDRAVQRLGELAGTKIVLDPAVMKTTPIDPAMPVDLHLYNVELHVAFERLIDQLPDRTEYIVLAPQGKGLAMVFRASLPVVVRVYDVRDLLAASAKWNLMNAQRASTPNNSSSPSNGSVFAPTDDSDVARLIEDSVQPDVGRDNGAQEVMNVIAGHLIVTGPRDLHRAVEIFLRDLRTAAAENPFTPNR